MPLNPVPSSGGRGTSGSLVRLVLLSVTVSGLFLIGDSRAEVSPARPSWLFSTYWSAAAYTEKAGGTVCWITGADGSVRLEALRNDRTWGDSPPNLAPLMNRSGNGWTLVLGPDQTGTLNAWGSEWRQVPPGLAQLVRLVVTTLDAGPGISPEFPFSRRVGTTGQDVGISRPKFLKPRNSAPGGSGTWRYQLSPLALENDGPSAVACFRKKMTARGRGTGGVGEILILRWVPGPAGRRQGLRINSSRRPGTLHLAPVGQVAVNPPDPEVFLPLWPLSQFFQTR